MSVPTRPPTAAPPGPPAPTPPVIPWIGEIIFVIVICIVIGVAIWYNKYRTEENEKWANEVRLAYAEQVKKMEKPFIPDAPYTLRVDVNATPLPALIELESFSRHSPMSGRGANATSSHSAAASAASLSRRRSKRK